MNTANAQTPTIAPTPAPSPKRWWPLVLALLVLAALATQLPALWRYAVATTLSLQAQDLARQWQNDTTWQRPNAQNPQPSPEQWNLASLSLETAIEHNPNNAQLHETLALLHINHLHWHQPEPQQARAALERATELLRQATQLRPMSGNTWAAKALALYGLDTDPTNTQHQQQLWHAFDLAMQYGHSNPSVQQSLAQIAFARWPQLSPERQAAVRHMAQQATPRQRQRLEAIATSHGLSSL